MQFLMEIILVIKAAFHNGNSKFFYFMSKDVNFSNNSEGKLEKVSYNL